MSNKGPEYNAEATLVRDHSVVAGVERPAAEARLVMLRGVGAPRVFALSAAETVIGRSNQANICIESDLLSRRHIDIKKAGAEFRLSDLGSANGVYLNGVKIHSARLHEGDTIQIGDVVLLFHEGSG